MSDTFDVPGSRNEAILQNMLGANNPLEPPGSRIEDLLQQLLEEGSGGGGWMIFNEDLLNYHAITLTMDEAKRIVQNGEPFIVQTVTQNYLFVHEKVSNIPDGQGATAVRGVLIGGGIFLYDPVEIRKGQFVIMSGWESGRFQTYDSSTDSYVYGVDGTVRYFEIPEKPAPDSQYFNGSKFYLGYDSNTNHDNFRWVEVVPRIDIELDSQSETALYQVISLLVDQAKQTGQPANVYVPFGGDGILTLAGMGYNAHANVAMVVPSAFGNRFVFSLTSYLIGTSCTFQGTLVADDTSEPAPSFSTIDVEIHFTLTNAAISVSPPKSYTPLPVGD